MFGVRSRHTARAGGHARARGLVHEPEAPAALHQEADARFGQHEGVRGAQLVAAQRAGTHAEAGVRPAQLHRARPQHRHGVLHRRVAFRDTLIRVYNTTAPTAVYAALAARHARGPAHVPPVRQVQQQVQPARAERTARHLPEERQLHRRQVLRRTA